MTAGNSAGFVDPWLAETLFFAMQSWQRAPSVPPAAAFQQRWWGSFLVTAPTDVPYWAGRVVRSNRFEIVKTGFADPAPTEKDRDYNGISAETQLSTQTKGTGVWCEASIEDVQANMSFTGYPSDRIHYVQGMVENTIPANMPDKIALLRLDTDWYASTKHELEHLYPLLEKGGVLLIDDYGHWQGARQAVDEYFAKSGMVPLLARIDSTCRCFVKPL